MPKNVYSLARSSVQKMQPYITGKPIEEARRELGLENLIKLASNENPRGPSRLVQAAVMEVLPEANRYPDGNGYYLKQVLAERHGVSADCITLGNGSNDILELVASAFLDTSASAIYSEHAFIIYALATARAGAKAQVVPALNYGHDLVAIANAVTEETRVIYLANPNNPTGGYFSEQALVALLNQLPESVLVVLDEAYFEYVANEDYPNGMVLQRQYPNLIITRTFSKAYGLSGFRVGYAVSDPAIADILNRVRQPFNVTALSLAAAQAALKDVAYISDTVSINKAGMEQLEQGLHDLQMDYIPSVANFLSFSPLNDLALKKPNIDSALVNRMLLERGVIVREIAGYGLASHLRVSIGLEEENQYFLEQLKNVMDKIS